MTTIDFHEARTHLSRLVEQAAAGEEVIIATAGRNIAKLVPMLHSERIRFGLLKGQFTVPENFDEALPEQVLASFGGGK